MSIPRVPLPRAAHAREVDAVEQHRELSRVELHADVTLGGGGPTEATGLEALVEDDEAAVVPGEDFHAVATAREEDEVAAGVDILAPGALRDGGQPIDAVAHVSGLAREEDAHRTGEQQHALPQPGQQLGHVPRGHIAREVHAHAARKLDRDAAHRLLSPR